MSEEASADTPSGEQPELAAMVLRSLCSGVKWGPSTPESPPVEAVASDWQLVGRNAPMAEVHTLLAGAPRGRGAELLGRVAAAGEQLGLAWTCLLEAQRWQKAPQSGGRENMATQALAEMSGYYATATAHGLINVTLRTLLLSHASADAINQVRDYRSAKGFPPFSTGREAWRPFNSRELDLLKPAVGAAADGSVSEWFAIVVELAEDDRWRALTSRRHEYFHQWRPQSISGGVQTKNPWEAGDGFASLSFPNYYEPLDPSILVAEALDGLEALGEVMGKWMDAWPLALKGLGCPIFKVNEPRAAG
jgi:hypothetical protein